MTRYYHPDDVYDTGKVVYIHPMKDGSELVVCIDLHDPDFGYWFIVDDEDVVAVADDA